MFQRRFGEVVRLEVQDDMPPHLRTLLLEELRDADLPATTAAHRGGHRRRAGTLLDLGDLMALATLDMPELRDPPFVPPVPRGAARSATRSIFDVIRERDLLVHHPFDSFSATVERFLAERGARTSTCSRSS